MELPAFAAARRAAAPCCCGAGRAAVSRYLLPAGTIAANPPHAAAADEWYRQADGQTGRTPSVSYGAWDRQTDGQTDASQHCLIHTYIHTYIHTRDNAYSSQAQAEAVA